MRVRSSRMRRMSAVVMPFLLLLLLAACGEGDDGGDSADDSGDDDSAAADDGGEDGDGGDDGGDSEGLDPETEMPFPDGETLVLMVTSEPGGGHDTFARILAEHLPDFLPGDVNIRVENLPGSEGEEGIRTLADPDTPRDGSHIATIHRRWLQRDVIGEGSDAFEPREQSIGSIRRRESSHLLWARQDVCMSWEECVEGDPLIVGEGDPGGGSSMGPAMAYMAGANLEIVYGYGGSAEINAAQERGEVQAQARGASALPANAPELCEEEIVYPIAKWGAADALVEEVDWCWETLGLEEEPPQLEDLAELDEGERRILSFVSDTVELARGSYYVPPDTPDEVREWWTAKLEEIATSEEFINAALDAGYDTTGFGHSPPEQITESLAAFDEVAEADEDAIEMMKVLQGQADLRRFD